MTPTLPTHDLDKQTPSDTICNFCKRKNGTQHHWPYHRCWNDSAEPLERENAELRRTLAEAQAKVGNWQHVAEVNIADLKAAESKLSRAAELLERWLKQLTTTGIYHGVQSDTRTFLAPGDKETR